MAGINHLKEVYEKKGDDFLSGLLNSYVIINEKIDGTFFGVKKTKDDQFKYFKKSGEISYVDRVLMQYYNSAISYFESMPLEKRQRIPENFFFGFEYFTNSDSKSSNFDRLPANNLVLSYIHKLDTTGKVLSTVQSKEQLDRWADYLGVERPPIIFEGKLDPEQKSAILDFAYSASDSLFNKFKTTSFTKYILSILNADRGSAFLKDKTDGGIDTIVFRFYEESNNEAKLFLAKIVDPIFQKRGKGQSENKESITQDYIWLIIIDLMNHFEMYNTSELQKMVTSAGDFDEKYVQLINQIFKDFISEYSEKYAGLILDMPEYLKRPEFNLDMNLIKDQEVIKLIKNSETYTEIYKILLNFFRKTRKRSGAGFFNDNLLSQLNLIVGKIRNIIMGDELYEGLFPSFSEFIGSANEELVLSESDVAKGKHLKEEPTKVNILIGNFQPVTIGHIKAAQKLKEKNGYPIVFVAIKPKKTNANSPFSMKETLVMLEKTQHEYPDLIESVKIIPSGQIEEIIEEISPKYIPVLWGTSERRLNEYLLQLDYIKKKKIPLRLSSEFKIVELPSYIKSENVIASIKNSNFAEFKKMVPNSITSEFFNLQKELLPSVTESIDIKADKLKEKDNKNENII
jgi:cytidyltransferase-like protein